MGKIKNLGAELRDALAFAAEHSPDCPTCGRWMLFVNGVFFCPDCEEDKSLPQP